MGNKRVRFNGVLKVLVAFLVCMGLFFSGTAAHAAISVINEVRYILNLYFVDDVTEEDLKAGTIEELVDGLGDPYTSYMSPEAYEAFMNSINQEYTGIGVVVEQDEEGILILSVFPGSGAADVGLKAGDIILEADGHSLKGLDVDEAGTYLLGEAGTKATLKIKRGSQVFTLWVKRKYIEVPTIGYQWLEEGIAYIKIYSFGENTGEDFAQVVSEMEANDPIGYIIDLRGNGGGYLDTALKIAGHFIDDQVALKVSNKYRDGSITAYPQEVNIDSKVFILADQYTASASEVLSGALQDYGRAQLIGSKTFGKGCMQNIFELSNGGLLKVTTNYCYTPTGREFNGIGLPPDLEINSVETPYAAILLLGGQAEESPSNEGYVGIKVNDTLYDIDIAKARQDEYWEGYGEIVAAMKKEGEEILLGTGDGWKPFDPNSPTYQYYYPGYKEVPVLENIPRNKIFNVSFSKEIKRESAQGKIYLVNSKTGQKVDCHVISVYEKTAMVAPKQILDSGQEYYLVMEEGIEAVDGTTMKRGALCRAIVAK